MADLQQSQPGTAGRGFRAGLSVAWAASAALLLVLLVLVGIWSLRQIEDRARSRARNDGMRRIETIRHRILEEVAVDASVTLDRAVRSSRWINVVLDRQASSAPNIEWIAILSPAGTVLARSGGSDAAEAPAEPVHASPSSSIAGAEADSASSRKDAILYSVPVMVGDRNMGSVQIAISAQGLDATVAELTRPVQHAFLLLICISFVVLALGGFVMRQLRNRERSLDRATAKQEHLAAMGSLARRMVHEIRNPLNAMRMQIAVVQDMLAGPQRASETVRAEHLERLDQEVTRLEKLAKSFLVFGRPPVDQPEQIRLRDAIVDVAEFVRPAFERIGARVEVQIEEDAKPLVVHTDKSKLREVLLNLAENAREAMDGGKLTIRLAKLSGKEALIQIADTGRGIPEVDLPMILQGIRSTKLDGSGLGLLIVKRIVEDAGGSIAVDSQIGRGTRFDIVLPTIPREG